MRIARTYLNLWVLVLVSLLALAACSKKTRTPAERGRGTFLRLCSGCHGQDGRGTKQRGFKVPPRDLSDPAFQERLTDDAIKAAIRNGKGQMPAFGPLMPEQDLNELVLHIRSLRKGP